MPFESDASGNRTFLSWQRWMLIESDVSRIQTLLHWQRWMLFELDASRDWIFHTDNIVVSGMDALVTVCSSVLARVSGEGDKP